MHHQGQVSRLAISGINRWCQSVIGLQSSLSQVLDDWGFKQSGCLSVSLKMMQSPGSPWWLSKEKWLLYMMFILYREQWISNQRILYWLDWVTDRPRTILWNITYQENMRLLLGGFRSYNAEKKHLLFRVLPPLNISEPQTHHHNNNSCLGW